MYFETVRSKDATWIKDKIGAKLNSMIVSASSPKMTVMEINGFDREMMAINWINKTHLDGPYYRSRLWSVINEFYNGSPEEFAIHLAIYIDKRIVQAYIKAEENLDVSPSQVVVTLDKNGNLPYGLEYKYSENYTDKTSNFVVPATECQIEYLKSLAIKHGYYFYDSNITKEAASSYINFFKNIDYLTEPEGFDTHFSKAI